MNLHNCVPDLETLLSKEQHFAIFLQIIYFCMQRNEN